MAQKLIGLYVCMVAPLLLAQPAFTGEMWRAQFDEACAKTTAAMDLSSQELKALVEKCNLVQKAIEAEDETTRKVYLKRLQMCRNLYLYVLEAKDQQKASSSLNVNPMREQR